MTRLVNGTMTGLIYFTFIIFIKGSMSLSVLTPFEIYVQPGINSSIVLNCTYKDERYNNIITIIWYKKENDKYKRLASFGSFGASCGDAELKNRSSCVGYGPNSTSAIMYINDVRCEDDGDYRCVVSLFENNQEGYGNTTVYVQAKEEIPKEFTMQPNNSLEENNVVNFSCSANVGNPEGVVRILQQRNDFEELLGESSVSDNRIENCTTFSHFTLHYNLSRHDQGAIFWCSSQNKMTMVPARSREIGPVEIFYAPSSVSITVLPDKTSVYIGDRIHLTCTSDGHPRPTFQWTFNSTNIVDENKYHLSDDNTTIEFNINNITDNGYYQCIASNIINGKPSNSVMITVHEKNVPSTGAANLCSENVCSFFENCFEKHDTAMCSIDIWKLISFVFIGASLVLGLTTVSLCLSLRLSKHKIRHFNSGATMSDVLISKSPEKFEDFGGYADPKDVKRPETNIKGDNDGRDNPYADPLDTKTMYTFVQKNYENPVKSSSPSPLSDTTSQSLANSQGPDSTCNHVNSSSPGDVSDNCPKPPNVYDDAWV